jgi:hypothetical protein
MAMAWRGFKSSSVQGFPLFSQIDNLTIPSNCSEHVQTLVYDTFVSRYGLIIPKSAFMNPACISFYCCSFMSNSKAGKAATIVEKKLIEEICEDLVPLLTTFTTPELTMMYLLAYEVCPTDPEKFFASTKSFFDQFLTTYDTSEADYLARYRSHFPDVADVPPYIYGIGYDSTYTAVLQMLVEKDGTLNDSTLLLMRSNDLPFPLETANTMNILSHCGEALHRSLKEWKKNGTVDAPLAVVEKALHSSLGPDIEKLPVFVSLINDLNNSILKKQLSTQYEPKQSIFPFYGSFLLVAFRNCTIHSGLLAAYDYFPGKGKDIINVARAVKNSGELKDIACFLNYL